MRHHIKMRTIFIAALLTVLAIGCAPKEEAAPTTSSTPSSTSSPATTAEKAKCDFCGTEVAKAELVAHDGKMACAKCIASHNH